MIKNFKMDKKIYLIAIPVILGMIVLSFYSGYFMTTNAVSGAVAGNAINYESMACIAKNGEQLGCYKNVYTTSGKEIVKACIGQGACASTWYISTCNVTGGGVCTVGVLLTWRNFTNESGAPSGCGMDRAAATYSNNSDTSVAGNFSLYKVFTSTCNGVVVNATALQNGTYTQANHTLAVVGFPNVTLAINDQLTINWTIYTT